MKFPMVGLQNHILLHAERAGSLVIADGQFNLLMVCVGMYGLEYSLYHSLWGDGTKVGNERRESGQR